MRLRWQRTNGSNCKLRQLNEVWINAYCVVKFITFSMAKLDCNLYNPSQSIGLMGTCVVDLWKYRRDGMNTFNPY